MCLGRLICPPDIYIERTSAYINFPSRKNTANIRAWESDYFKTKHISLRMYPDTDMPVFIYSRQKKNNMMNITVSQILIFCTFCKMLDEFGG